MGILMSDPPKHLYVVSYYLEHAHGDVHGDCADHLLDDEWDIGDSGRFIDGVLASASDRGYKRAFITSIFYAGRVRA
jgi:hypothetical protein